MPRMKSTEPLADHIVTDDRFKLIPVTSRISIKDLVTKSGISFQPGRGFYQLTKAETIQAYKEIVAVRKSDGAKVSGERVRELLKIPSGAAKFKFTGIDDFDVFVQSTSFNRVLLPDTQFLYEVNAAVRGVPSPKKLSPPDLSREVRNVPPPVFAAGSPIELVFCFDTTGSMSSCLTEVRKNVSAMIKRIMDDIPTIKIAVFAHGDYCDKRSTYVTKFVDLTVDQTKLTDFVNNVSATGGGDFEECYELALKEIREKLSWSSASQKALVMIGDALPHTVDDYKSKGARQYNTREVIDWRYETDQLARMGCRIYAVQYVNSHRQSETTNFWASLAFKTYGQHLNLSNFSNVFDFIMAICYREQGAEQFEAYKQEVVKRTATTGGLNADLHALFDNLGSDPSSSAPVPSAIPDAISTATSGSAPSSAAGRKRVSASVAVSPAKRARAKPPKSTPAKRASATLTKTAKTDSSISMKKVTSTKKVTSVKKVAAAKRKVTPVKKVAAAKRKVTPVKKVAPAKRKVTPAKKVAAAKRKVTPAKKVAAAKRKVTLAKKVAPAKRKVTPVKKVAPVKSRVTPASSTASRATKKASPAVKKVSRK